MNGTSGRAGARTQKVIVRDGSREVHGYAVGQDRALVDVVWAVLSGRLRRRTFPLEDVYLPGMPPQWAGLPVPDDKLHVLAHEGRIPLSAQRHGKNS